MCVGAGGARRGHDELASNRRALYSRTGVGTLFTFYEGRVSGLQPGQVYGRLVQRRDRDQHIEHV